MTRFPVDRLAYAGASLAFFAASALGQGPSFSTVPGETGYIIRSISPSGQHVLGARFPTNFSSATLFRFNRITGAKVVLSAVPAYVGEVIDDGRVFASTSYSLDRNRLLRWVPETGSVTLVPYINASGDDTIQRVSNDGRYVVAATDDETALALVDFDQNPPFVLNLETAPGVPQLTDPYANAIGGITDPINGVRFIRGFLSYPGSISGATWPVGSAFPTQDSTIGRVIDVSPDGRYVLGEASQQLIVRGDGPDRTLVAPIQPVIHSGPVARAMSDDGSVVVGWALRPASLIPEEPVIWRKGLQPATFRTIMTNAGVALPAWTSSVLLDVSADGSTVVGSYITGQDPDVAPRTGFHAVLPAPNDTCETARVVSYGTVVGSTLGATRAGVSGGCHAEGAAPDVWYVFTPAANETVSIDTCGSTFDTTLTLFRANTCGALGAPVACNDDAAVPCAQSAVNSRINASVTGGLPYFIRVSGWNGAYGSVRLTITATNRPANDTCEQAVDIPVNTGVPFNNSGALTDSRATCAGSSTPFSDVWFRTVAPENGRMTFSTCGSTINTVINVYDGSACANVSAAPIACAAGNAGCAAVGGGNGSRITVPCVAGQTLLVRVGGLFGQTGAGQIVATFACDAEVSSPYSILVRNTSPVAYWRFEDSGHATAADSIRFDAYSCGDNRGEYVGDVPRPSDFQGRCLSLNGAGAHVRVWGAAPLTNPNGCGAFNEVVLEAWVKTTDPYAGVIITNRNIPSDHSLTMVVGYNPIGLSNTAGKVLFVSDGPGVFFGAMSQVRIDDGNWHHVVGHRYHDGGSTYYYSIVIDDVWQGPANVPGVGFAHYGTSGTYWLIGNGTAWAPADAAFNGRIDEVAIYCGNWTPDVWTDHYQTGRPPVCGTADFDGDGDSGTDADIEAFFACLGGNCCPTCGSADFDADGDSGTDADIEAFFRVLGGGTC